MAIVKIDGETHFQTEINKEGLKIVKFGASWCAPCKEVDKTLENIANEIEDDILKIDVDLDAEIAGEFGIMSIPTIVYIKDKQVKSHMVGVQTKEMIKQAIRAIKNESIQKETN